MLIRSVSTNGNLSSNDVQYALSSPDQSSPAPKTIEHYIESVHALFDRTLRRLFQCVPLGSLQWLVTGQTVKEALPAHLHIPALITLAPKLCDNGALLFTYVVRSSGRPTIADACDAYALNPDCASIPSIVNIVAHFRDPLEDWQATDAMYDPSIDAERGYAVISAHAPVTTPLPCPPTSQQVTVEHAYPTPSEGLTTSMAHSTPVADPPTVLEPPTDRLDAATDLTQFATPAHMDDDDLFGDGDDTIMLDTVIPDKNLPTQDAILGSLGNKASLSPANTAEADPQISRSVDDGLIAHDADIQVANNESAARLPLAKAVTTHELSPSVEAAQAIQSDDVAVPIQSLHETESPSSPNPRLAKRSFDAVSFKHDLATTDQRYAKHGRYGGSNVLDMKTGAQGYSITLASLKFGSRTERSSNPCSRKSSISSSTSDRSPEGAKRQIEAPTPGSTHQQVPETNTARDVGDKTDVSVGSPVARLLTDSDTQLNDLESIFDMFSFDGSDIMAVAQLVADQAQYDSQVAPRIRPRSGWYTDHDSILPLLHTPMSRNENGQAATPAYTLPALLDRLQTTNIGPMHRPFPRKHARSVDNSKLYHIPTPFVKLSRAEIEWEMLPTACNFWEVLNLEPCAGPKDIAAVIAIASNDDFALASHDFVSALASKYERFKLGTHAEVGNAACHNLTPEDDGDIHSVIRALHRACQMAVQSITLQSEASRHTMLYVVDPFEHRSMSRFVCACAFDAVRTINVAKTDASISIRLLSASAIIAYANFELADMTLGNDHFGSLARSIYDQMPCMTSKRGQSGLSSTCTQLVDATPAKICFQLQSDAPRDLLRGPRVLHLAYSLNAGGDWLSVAWTDCTGTQRSSSNLCLRGTEATSTMSHVIELTRAMLNAKDSWKVIIAKVGAMSAQDRILWCGLACANVKVFLLDIASPASLDLRPPAPALPKESLRNASGSLSADSLTPKSAEMVGGSMPTGVGMDLINVDTDLELRDSRDETWAVILPLSTTNPPKDQANLPKKVIMGGMLVQRDHQIPGDTAQSLVTFGVDLIEVTTTLSEADRPGSTLPHASEAVLREVLAWYRGLALLAKIQNVRRDSDVVPWHVATVINSADALAGFLPRDKEDA